MTRYNNETYKIDDIAWNENPMSTFNGRHGEITYVDYYQNKYNRAIRNHVCRLLPEQVQQ